MPVTNKNIPFLHRKEWQMMCPAPIATTAGSFAITDTAEEDKYTMLVFGGGTQMLYNRDEDSWLQIQSANPTGSFGAGSCGGRSRWSATVTATGGSTTSVVTTAGISGLALGKTIRFLTGNNAGQQVVCTGCVINPAGTSTLQFAALPVAVASTDTFCVDTGRFWLMNAGTVATGNFRVYDLLTGTWSSPSVANLPGTWGTDGKLICPTANDVFATNVVNSATTTTLTTTAKTWTANQWTNYQVRIIAGTGLGQVRTVASNTANVLTLTAAFAVTPDSTSQYEITANDDFMYLMGNASTVLYRYSISANAWTVLAPTTGRAGNPGAGMSGNWIGKTGDAVWGNESAIGDGRYLYSFRAGGGGALDRYDIALNTWLAVPYINNAETFNTGSGFAAHGRYLYVRKDGTHRFFKFDLPGNFMEMLNTNLYGESTAVIGDKLWGCAYKENGVEKLFWLYSLRNSGTELHRLLLY